MKRYYAMCVIMAGVLASFLAAHASADELVYPAHMAHKRALEARMTSMPATSTGTDTASEDDDASCLQPLMSVYSLLPTPPPALVSYEQDHPATDACSYSVPDSLTADLKSYDSEVLTWYTSYSDDILSALSQCPSLASEASSLVPLCATATDGGKSATQAVPAATTGLTSGNGTTGLTSGNGTTVATTHNSLAAEVEAGIVGAVLALFIGFVLVL